VAAGPFPDFENFRDGGVFLEKAPPFCVKNPPCAGTPIGGGDGFLLALLSGFSFSHWHWISFVNTIHVGNLPKAYPPMKARLRTLKTKGFALVATLSLMILLTLIAVGLLTLSTVTVRAGGRDEAMATARANARLALMIALGELQRTMGPDQGVSAPAAAVFPDKTAQRPHLTGVWKGWHWTPTPGGTPPYSAKKGTFARWLVSTPNADDAKKFDLPQSAAPTGTDGVRLVGSTTELKDSQDISTQVIAEKVAVGDPTKPSGKYAWAVFDESTKAPIHLGDPATAPKDGEEIASRTVPHRVRADVLDSKLDELKTSKNLYSLETAVVPVGVSERDEISKRFHDFTTGSVGLLTDTANGGLKKDLTPLFEADTLPSQAFPVATVYPSAFGPTYGPPTWAYLHNHYRKYKTINATSGVPTYNSRTGGDMDVTRGGSNGVISTPTKERLIPVIAKFQMVFSVVTHDIFNVEGRPTWWTQNGKPQYRKDAQGIPNYGVLHLAYDPVLTLYNPYDVALDLTKIRFRIWDPPVGFRFKKYEYLTDSATGNLMAKRVVKEGYLRPTSTNDGFAGLAELQHANQTNTNARKCFTLILSEGTGQALTGQLKLQPGEVKVFSPRVESDWKWGFETSGGWNLQGTFFDFDQGRKFANVDRRASANLPPNKFGEFGIECAPGWDVRAGLQTDHLALSAPRASETEYDFEANRSDGYVTLRSWDPVEVEAKPLVRSGTADYHFQVDVLAANTIGSVPDTRELESDSGNTGVRDDTLRSYKFNFSSREPTQEISENPNQLIKTKKLTCQELMQADNDSTKGGKYPFAMLELSARNTLDGLTDSKPWLHNNFVVEGGLQNSSLYGLTHQSYDLRLKKLEGTVDSFPQGIEIDPNTYRGYFGASGAASEGSSFVTMNHVPLAPAASLGDLIPANLAASALMPRAVHPFGNSYSHPLIPADQVSKGLVVDHPYLLNDSLWDSYFFSSFADYAGGVISTNRSLKDVIKGTLDGSKPALNTRLIPVVSGDPSKLADTISALAPLDRSKQVGKYTAINGAFNVNSASVDAWRAVLSSLRDRAIYGLKLTGQNLQDATYDTKDETPFVRTGKPLADKSETGPLRWSAFRTLSDDQIETLAEEIVKQIALRGKDDSAPSMTLGEFVNRRISNNSLQRKAGLLQTAIDATDINKDAYDDDSKTVSAASINEVRKKGLENSEALDGNSGEGVPTVITQGDLMAALAPIATVRGDTFKIRAYGEALDATGKVITARAWCEAIVQRVPDYVDPADAPEIALSALTSQVNKDFGRQFRIVSFKQLSEDEL
jgi:hypothetical protein